MSEDHSSYQQKKDFFRRVLTVYGRKPVLEAMNSPNVKIFRLHLATTNKPAGIINELIDLAKQQHAEVKYHSKSELSRISKNAKQDQGVAVDLIMEGFQVLDGNNIALLAQQNIELIALDNVTNPQNLGMVIRSVCASPLHGLILPEKGCAKLDSLVIKASAGTLFKAKIYRCDNLHTSLTQMTESGFDVVGLSLDTHTSINDLKATRSRVFVLGNESEGISKNVANACSGLIKIPMANNVESLNVAVTASLIAFRSIL